MLPCLFLILFVSCHYYHPISLILLTLLALSFLPFFPCYHPLGSKHSASALHHPHFCQPSFCGVLLTMYQRRYSTFLLQDWCPTHQACWLLAFWHDAILPTCPVLSHHVRTVQTHAGWWQSPALSRNRCHTPTQPIPFCGLMGCQDHYRSPGLA